MKMVETPVLYVLLLLATLLKVAAVPEETYGGIELWGEEQDFEITETLDTELHALRTKRMERVPVNVDGFGAVGDGISDDTQAFKDAWNMACSLKNAVFLVPEGRRYLVSAVRFKGPCHRNMIIQIAGTIVAPDEPNNWDPKNPRVWLVFSKLNVAWIQGGGVIDGSGSKWWASSCKINKTNPCRGAPTAITIDSSSVVRVKDLNIKNSQQIHFTAYRSNAVRIYNIRVHAPHDSPNTDGIHISRTTNVVIQNCQIGTGDDCISIVNASSNIRMKNIDCGPGHGISIGSLGKRNSTAVVTGIVLDTAILRGTTNGLRIKTWQGGSGFVRGLRFENVKMANVSNPIIIDQFYCDSPVTCKNQTSAVKISQVLYRNISGTSRTSNAIKFACSNSVPCSSIVLNNIDLQRTGGLARTFCNCAIGFDYGHVRPTASCLRSIDPHCVGAKADNLRRTHPVHTEL